MRKAVSCMIMSFFMQGVWAETSTLVIGKSLVYILEAHKSVVIPLQTKAGDFIVGELKSTERASALNLLDSDGHFVRQLMTDMRMGENFLFVADQSGMQLKLISAEKQSEFTVSLSRQLPLSLQNAPARKFLSPSIESIAQSLVAGATTKAFWSKVKAQGTPLVEKTLTNNYIVTFLYQGAKKNVRILGAPSSDHDLLEHLLGSDIWFKSYNLPADTRLSYQISPDIPEFSGSARERRVAILATSQVDPYNPNHWSVKLPNSDQDYIVDKYNQLSILELSEAPLQLGLDEKSVAHGLLKSHQFQSIILHSTREISIYLPVNYNAEQKDNRLLFVFDAKSYLTKVPTPTILDNLIATEQLPPTVVVFVSNPSQKARARELPANPEFARMMAEELLPWVIKQTGIQHQAKQTALAGSSYGGLAAMTVALTYPQAFGNVLSLSGSFWWHPQGSPESQTNYVASLVANSPTEKIRFFLAAGLFEFGRQGSSGILENNRYLRDVLVAKGYTVQYREYASGHDYYAWRGELGDGLIALFGKKKQLPQ